MGINFVYKKKPTGDIKPVLADEKTIREIVTQYFKDNPIVAPVEDAVEKYFEEHPMDVSARKAVADYFDENPIIINDSSIMDGVIKHLVAYPWLIVNNDSIGNAIQEVVNQYFEETGFADFMEELELAIEAILEQIPTKTSQLENDSNFVTKNYVDNAIINNMPIIPDADTSDMDGATILDRIAEFLNENEFELADIPTAMSVIMEHDRYIFEHLQGYGLLQQINEAIALEDETVANIVPILKNVQGNLDDIFDIKKALGDVNSVLNTLVDAGGES